MLSLILSSCLVLASVVCENGVCRLVPDETNDVPVAAAAPQAASVDRPLPAPARTAEGVMSEGEFLAFLRGEGSPAGDGFAGKSLALILLFAVLGGLAMNLTPCVLPMVPVNVLVIGASWRRGLLYGLGQFLSFGTLGLVAALGGAAFGTIQSSPWFNLAVAVLFLALAISLTGVFALDFTRFRTRAGAGAFALGAVSALLAGACVAPILVSVLVLAARLSAEGSPAGYVLPFAVAFGLALPWPFLGAGLRVLPKPGAWMKWVNRAFAVFLAVLAFHYASLAVASLGARGGSDGRDLTAAELKALLARTPRAKPLVVFCHADWCHNCPAMERLLASSDPVRKALAGMELVRFKIQTPADLKAFPGLDAVRGIPAFAVYR